MKTKQILTAILIVIMATAIALSGMTALIIIQAIIAAVVISLSIVIAFRKGRPIVFAALMVSALLSCSKEDLPKPQTVTYEVWCDACAIVLEDALLNRTKYDNITDWKVFQVNGYLKYSFVNTTGLTEASANVYVSVFNRSRQEIKLKMYEDLHERSDESEAIIDFPNGIGTDYNLSVNLRLN